jgi:hypothetical protein
MRRCSRGPLPDIADGQAIDTGMDLSAGSFRYIEDCQVCCQPIDLAGEVDESGERVGVTAERA